MKFELVSPNLDLSVHDDPPGAWQRVVVLTGWQDAKIGRKRWPHAACVGPMRTVDGIDLLVRNLLANDQVRIIVIDGPFPGLGAKTRAALTELFRVDSGEIPQPLCEECATDWAMLQTIRDAIESVSLYDVKELFPAGLAGIDFGVWLECSQGVTLEVDRPGGRHVLPPPPPKVTAEAPHGDPGDRVVGETLAEVWPLVLDRVMKCGRTVSGGKDQTREYLNLTSVIRDVPGTIADLRKSYLNVPGLVENDDGTLTDNRPPSRDVPHPVLGMTWADVETYAAQWLDGLVPEGAPYSYGSRLIGEPDANRIRYRSGDGPDDRFVWASFDCAACPEEMSCFEAVMPNDGEVSITRCPRGHDLDLNSLRATAPCTSSGFPETVARFEDQIAAVTRLLSESPGTRAAYLTPWRPDEDSGKETGRPCLVGIWLRGLPGRYRVFECDEHVTAGALLGEVSAWDISKSTIGFDVPCCAEHIEGPRLHMTIAFRSHDMVSGYPQNLAAACLLLQRFAGNAGMAPGTITCHSYSAHVYDRAWNYAQKVAAEARQPVIRWDPRSQWRIELYETDTIPARCDYSPSQFNPDASAHTCEKPAVCQEQGAFTTVPVMGHFMHYRCDEHAASNEAARLTLPRLRALRAIAHEPGDSGRVIAVYEGPTVGAVALQVGRSGLCQEPGGLLWLGAELARVAAKGGLS